MTKKIRRFKVQFAHGALAKANNIMREWGIWNDNQGARVTAEISTTNTLSVEEYTDLLRESLAGNGGQLFSLEEIK